MKSQHGLQLIELMLVVAILGIVALVTMPYLSTSDPARLDLAAQEVADALRYARAEAIRTGQAHGVLIDHDDSQATYKDIAVYRVDTTTSPYAIAALVYHPLDKQPYDRQVLAGADSRGIRFANTAAPFTFNAISGARRHVHFDASGAPVLFQDGVAKRLQSGDVLLSQGQNQRTVSVQPQTGRVTVQ